ncbi:Hypothetical predicted protein [Mytilus galloprovincialis]|uniref:Uncharacterized protein n=1 Tax=Mytilus galloprovincialis TaxID=29158 RepID=A0A8B6BI10_MYTGA|nr:Hypothetical predicted protein [Mytilus galloprovincialis]
MKGGDSDETYSTTPLNIKKRRRRKSSKPSPSSQVEDKRQRTNSEISSESDTDSESEQSDCYSRGKDEMSNPSDLLPKVSLTEIDIVRIAETVKQLLKDDIDKTVERVHSRKGLLRLSGVPFSRGENTTEKVIDIVKRIGVNIKDDDISVSHRTGKFRENKTRQIIARFPKHDLKVEILKSAKKLREIPGLQDICINQDLTKTRDEIAFKARAYVRNHRLKATWVVDGKVMIIGKDNKKHAVTRMYDLNDYVFQSDNFTEINEIEDNQETEMQYASNGHDRVSEQPASDVPVSTLYECSLGYL